MHSRAVAELKIAVALLVLPLIRNPVWAVFYLSIFAVGTVAGMISEKLSFLATTVGFGYLAQPVVLRFASARD